MRRVKPGRALESTLIAIAAVVVFASCGGNGNSDGAQGGAAGSSDSSAGTASNNGGRSGGNPVGAAGNDASAGTPATSGAGGIASSGGTAGASAGALGLGGATANDGGTGESGGAAGTGTRNCDDGNASTVDFYKPAYGCGHLVDSNPNDGQSWINFDAGFSVDPHTSTAWYYMAAAGNVTQEQARTACAYLGIGTLEFRLPTIDDARSLGSGCPATAPAGTCPIHDPSCLSQACGYGTALECEACTGGANKRYVNPDAAPFGSLGFHTSSMCSDCTGVAQEWTYGSFNGNFLVQDPNQLWSAVCVIANLPDALP
jgi:hypothetical protein